MKEAGLAVATRRMHIQYLSIAEWGETLNISMHMLDVQETGGSSYVGTTPAYGSPVAECIVDWELVDCKSGETRRLPDRLY